MIRRAALLVTIAVAGCVKEPVYVPTVIERPIPDAPAECKSSHSAKLNPLPEAKQGDRIEDYVARAGKTHRLNTRQYGNLHSDHAVCGVYVRALTKSGSGG